MADNCGSYVSAEDLQAAKQSINHIEHVATSKDADGNPALVVSDVIRGVEYSNATLDGLFSDIGFKPVDGSFEIGGLIQNRWDTLLYEANGSFYSWMGTLPLAVPSGSSPFDSADLLIEGWVDRSDISLRSALASEDGFGNIGGSTYAQIRGYAGSLSRVYCLGRANKLDGGYGFFEVDPSDTVSADNGGTVLVDMVGRRWKRQFDGTINAAWFNDLQSAIDAAQAMTGKARDPSHTSGHPSWTQPNSVCKVVSLARKKFPISTTLKIHGGVSIDAGFGGVYLTDDFIPDSSGYAVRCDKGEEAQFSGHISNLLIDCRGKSVNGFRISDGYANQLDGIFVANCDGDGIHIQQGMGVQLSRFYAISVLNPSNPLSCAHIVEGSDHNLSNGEGRYFRFGTWLKNGGNNRIDKIHNWGMYDDRIIDQNSRMKCCFVVQDSINNSFSQCMADSPSKWDYTKSNIAAVDGYINGGMGFFIDANSEGNTFVACQTFINMVAFDGAGLSGYTASLIPFGVGSIDCTFVACENSESSAWISECIHHIFDIDDKFTHMSGSKNFVGVETDMVRNKSIFRKTVSIPLLVRAAKYILTSATSIEIDFSDNSYLSITATSDLSIKVMPLVDTLTGSAEVTLAVYRSAPHNISFSNVIMAQGTPSLSGSGTDLFKLFSTDNGATWIGWFQCRF